ncbi:hypothetical protein LTS18_013736, partial [Coniosporium uncinatum]
GSYLYNCFFSYKYLSPFATQNYILTPPGVFFGGEKYRDRLYGPLYGTNPASALWREYAKADRRWGGADLTVISLELLTVFVGGPLAVYLCSLLARGYGEPGRNKGKVGGKVAFWMSVLATGELYGGFMTFAPEWLSGNSSLDGSNWMYLWVYLVFFNMLWVFIPLWVLYVAYGSITGAEPLREAKEKVKKTT